MNITEGKYNFRNIFLEMAIGTSDTHDEKDIVDRIQNIRDLKEAETKKLGHMPHICS